MNPLTAVDERLQALEPVARRAVNSLCVPLSVWEDAHAAAMARIWQELDRYDPERFPGGRGLARAVAFIAALELDSGCHRDLQGS